MDTNVFMKLPNGCGTLTGDVVRREKAIYAEKQASRQWSLLLNKTLTEDAGMTQSKADPCVHRLGGKGRVCMILVVYMWMTS